MECDRSVDAEGETTIENEKTAVKGEEDMEEEEDSSSDSEESEDDPETERKIFELQRQVETSPFVYDCHIELIRLLQKEGELHRLRAARQNMADIFPLTEELWLEWIRDEIKVLTSAEDREQVTRLFERAVKDYLGVGVWLEYVQFVIGELGRKDGIQRIREVFERAVTAVGLHVGKGAMVWEAYREFENAILAGLQPAPGSVVGKEQQEQEEAQTARIKALFRRQLSVPLMDMQVSLEEYREWSEEEVDKQLMQLYQKALDTLGQVQPYEQALLKADPPRLEQYQTYIHQEQVRGDPARMQCLYERAVEENCLNHPLWLQYVNYLDMDLKVKDVVLPVHERSVRNCPWSADLWLSYLRSLERFDQSHDKVKEVFERALSSGAGQGPEHLSLWTAYCDYLRRRVDWTTDHKVELEEFRSTLAKAIDHLQEVFPEDGDPHCTLLQYWARIEAKFARNMEKARELWNQILQHGFSTMAAMWLEYFNLERSFGDHKHSRRVLQRAVNSVSDWPQTVCEAYINFEREEGTLLQYDQAVERCSAQLQRVEARTTKKAEKEAKTAEEVQKGKDERKAAKKKEKKQQKHAQKPPTVEPGAHAHPHPPHPDSAPHPSSKHQPHQQQQQQQQQQAASRVQPTATEAAGNKPYVAKRKAADDSPQNSPVKTDKDGFKVPPPPGYKPRPASPLSAPPGGPSAEPPAKKPKMEDVVTEPTKPITAKDECTVFVSNLDYSVDEVRLRQLFSPVGEVTDVRLVCNIKGKSKGFAYVEFKDEFAVTAALQMDRQPIDSRPMYVSRCESKGGGSAKFKFGTGLEMTKLFIKGLPFTTSSEALETIFKQHGALRSVRIVTYKSGAPKGLAYVEFEEESAASQAVMKTDGLQIGDHTISVAISNPPTRKAPLTQRDAGFTPSLGGGKRESGDRGKARTQLSLVPRSLQKKPPGPARTSSTSSSSSTSSRPTADDALNGHNSTAASSNSSAQDSASKLSNSDFRNLLLKK